jgi:LPS-assembly lipoprotein
MSWRSLAIAIAASFAACALSACGFQPMYGGTTASGSRLSAVMAGVEINPIPGRVGQKLRNELIFATTGGGVAPPTQYTLDIAIKESVTDQLVQITGDATGQVYQLDATFKLLDGHGKVLLQGTAISRAPYNRFQEIFANVRARYDAENRAARTCAETIRTRIAAYLANAA